MSRKDILSNSTLLKGLQYKKQLYLYKHHCDYQNPISHKLLPIFDCVRKVEKLIKKFFPNGIDVFPLRTGVYTKILKYTNDLIENGIEIIYETVFMKNEILIYAHILVKSSTSNLETYIDDVSVQFYVIGIT